MESMKFYVTEIVDFGYPRSRKFATYKAAHAFAMKQAAKARDREVAVYTDSLDPDSPFTMMHSYVSDTGNIRYITSLPEQNPRKFKKTTIYFPGDVVRYDGKWGFGDGYTVVERKVGTLYSGNIGHPQYILRTPRGGTVTAESFEVHESNLKQNPYGRSLMEYDSDVAYRMLQLYERSFGKPDLDSVLRVARCITRDSNQPNRKNVHFIEALQYATAPAYFDASPGDAILGLEFTSKEVEPSYRGSGPTPAAKRARYLLSLL
jgi:hypothetical protein